MSSSNDSTGSERISNIQSSATQLWSSMKNMGSVEKNQKEGGVQATAESVLRAMFGACTTGSSNFVEQEFDMVTTSKSNKTNSSDEKSPEMLYPHHVSQAVESLQEKQALTSRRSSSSSTKIPGLFPMSTPSKTKASNVQSQDSPVNFIPEDNAFDDGISSISAHTLEDMALAYEAMDGISRMRSDVTQDPHQKVEESWKQTAVRKGVTLREPGMGPLCLTRDGRSSNTRYSSQTKSTTSTQSEDFVSVFRKNELNYWNEIAKEGDARGKPNMKPSDFLTLAQDGTITTVNSSNCSGSPAFRKSRAHDGRLLDVLVLPPGTEVAEI